MISMVIVRMRIVFMVFPLKVKSGKNKVEPKIGGSWKKVKGELTNTNGGIAASVDENESGRTMLT